MAANESSAVASIRTINTGEITYNSAYPTVGYAATLTTLGGVSPCTPSLDLRVPDRQCAGGRHQERIYVFGAAAPAALRRRSTTRRRFR